MPQGDSVRRCKTSVRNLNIEGLRLLSAFFFRYTSLHYATLDYCTHRLLLGALRLPRRLRSLAPWAHTRADVFPKTFSLSEILALSGGAIPSPVPFRRCHCVLGFLLGCNMLGTGGGGGGTQFTREHGQCIVIVIGI